MPSVKGYNRMCSKAHVEVSKMVDELIMLGQRKRALEAKLNCPSQPAP